MYLCMYVGIMYIFKRLCYWNQEFWNMHVFRRIFLFIYRCMCVHMQSQVNLPMYVCMYVVCVCMYVVYVCMYVSLNVSLDRPEMERMWIWTRNITPIYWSMFTYMKRTTSRSRGGSLSVTDVCMYVCIYVCICVCIFVYIFVCMYVCLYTLFIGRVYSSMCVCMCMYVWTVCNIFDFYPYSKVYVCMYVCRRLLCCW